MKVTRLYTGADGQSHFDDIEVETSKLQPGDGIVFREGTPDTVNQWHRAPRRQYVINLSGETEIEIGNGTKRRVGPAIYYWQKIRPVRAIFRATWATTRAVL
jgi:hypothetical protein